MAKNKKTDQQNSETSKVFDPEIEAKIDAMMNPAEPDNKAADELPKPAAADISVKDDKSSKTSAPLLPNEELPDFQDAEQNQDSADRQQIEPPDPVNQPDEPPQTEPLDPEKPEESNDTLADDLGVEDRATGDAVDDIVTAESDRILAVDDAKAELTKDGVSLRKKGLFSKLKAGLGNFWANPLARWTSIIVVFLAIIAVFAVPTSRYYALNLAGVRASTSLRVVDSKTGQPLKNVEISLSGVAGKTDKDGQVSLDKIKLGHQDLAVKKPAFADLDQQITIGWGSNPLGDFDLLAVGSRYVFEVKDFLSDQPVDAEAISGQYSARANENGEIVLAVEDENIQDINIEIVAENYRTEKLNLPVGSKDTHKLDLVPASKHAFISKRDGQYDLYKIDADSKNEELVLKGTGNEREENTVILSHKDRNLIALVSTRGDEYNQDGYALSSLNIIDLDTNEKTKIADSERILLIDFIGDKLVFVKIKAGESGASPTRHRLISYDVETGLEKELASTNYFNDVLSANGIIYYSPAQYKVNGQVGFYSIKPDGSDKNVIFGEEVWNLFRTSYYKIAASVGRDWYEYDIGSGQFDKLGGAPPVLKSRVYADAPDSPNSAWVDERDGKGVLLLYNTETNEPEKVLQTQSGLSNPIRWLDDEHIVYRVANNSETADYVININGGEPKKIIDVTNTAGLDRWYYY